MFTTFTVVGFMFALAWAQQQYVNRLIEADLKYIEALLAKRATNYPSTPLPPNS